MFEEKKIDFRIYFIISQGKKIQLIDGFARICQKPYKKDILEREIHFSNTEYSSNKDNILNFEEIAQHLLKEYGYVFNRLIKKIKRFLSRLVEVSSINVKDGSFMLFAADFGLDTDLNGYFMEINSFPKLTPSSDKKIRIYENLYSKIVLHMKESILKIRKGIKLKFERSVDQNEDL